MAKIDNILLKSKFRGCLLGGLLGDCLGAPFEGEPGSRFVTQNYFDKLEEEHTKPLLKQYTDDTAMTKSVAKCLIDKPPIDFTYLAKLFVREYSKDPKRGYGANVVDVFHKLRGNKFDDIYKPAREQFLGSGSYGNGGAMRIAPVSLFFYKDYKAMVDVAKKVTELTHTNRLGVHGAILQCIAVHQSLHLDPNVKVNYMEYVAKLIDKMKEIEVEDDYNLDIKDITPYQTQLKTIQKMLSPKEYNKITKDEVATLLGNNIDALHSVPTAIYCYLRAQDKIPNIDAEDPFRRTIQYAISLGGDTDTIASMAGSIAGAHLSESSISTNLQSHCEFVEEMKEIADQLLQVISE